MDEKSFPENRESNQKSVSGLFFWFGAAAVVIPVLTMLVDANRTDLDRSIDGILVRDGEIAGKGGGSKVNLSRHQLNFDSRSAEKSDRTGGELLEDDSGDVIQTPIPVSFSPSEITPEFIDELAKRSEINPVALALPAARRFLGASSFTGRSQPAPLRVESTRYFPEDHSDGEFQLEPAQAFVESLRRENFKE